MDRFFDMIKRALWVIVQFSVLLLLVLGQAWLIYTNFTALKVSFELAGYDGTPVGEDLLTGPIWESLGLYDLTQAHMFAAAIALFVGLLSAVVFHHIYTAVRLLMDRREYARQGDTASVEQANAAIVRHLVWLGLVLVPLIPVGYWDLQLFRFRTVAPILGMEENAVAIKDWPLLMQQHSDLFAMSLARFGGFAYIALIAGAGLAVELWINHVKEALVRLGAAMQAWYEYLSGQENAETNQTVNQAVGPATAYTTPQIEETAEGTATQLTGNCQETHIENAGQGAGDVEWPEKPIIEPIYTSAPSDDQNSDEEVPVFDGAPGEKIKLSDAAADHENYFIDEMRRVWKRISSADAREDQPTAEAA